MEAPAGAPARLFANAEEIVKLELAGLGAVLFRDGETKWIAVEAKTPRRAWRRPDGDRSAYPTPCGREVGGRLMADGSEAIHVNGPAILWFDRYDRSAASMNRLGVSDVDGVTIEPMILRKEVKTDFVGSGLAADYITLGSVCRVAFTLTLWDADQLEIWRGGMRGRRGNAVSSNDIGRMMLAGNRFFQLLVQSTQRTGGVLESPYRFQTFIPDGPAPVNVGTRAGRVRLTGIAHPYQGFTYVRS
jgi:hypothetical protein